MKYDFTSVIERKGKDALAVDILPNMFGMKDKVEVREGLDYIPMWVADMDFKYKFLYSGCTAASGRAWCIWLYRGR